MTIRLAWPIFLLSTLLTITGCSSSSENIKSTSISLSDGQIYQNSIYSEAIYLNIRPKSEMLVCNASSARIIIEGETRGALINDGIVGGNSYNITIDLVPCKSIKPGRDIIIKYNYLSKDGSIVESGQVTLAEVVATCN